MVNIEFNLHCIF